MQATNPELDVVQILSMLHIALDDDQTATSEQVRAQLCFPAKVCKPVSRRLVAAVLISTPHARTCTLSMVIWRTLPLRVWLSGPLMCSHSRPCNASCF